MKLTGIETIVLDNSWIFLRLETDKGITGLGERAAAQIRFPFPYAKMIEAVFNEFFLGNSPFDIEKIWHTAYSARHDFRGPGLDNVGTIGALEIACWDIIGKSVNQPIHNLLGGRYWDKLRTYGYMPKEKQVKNDPSTAGAVAEEMVRNGIKICKIDPFSASPLQPCDIGLSVIGRASTIFKNMRDAVGDQLEIGIGTHGQFTTYSAVRAAQEMEQHQPFFFEEPVPPENVEEMARVARQTSIPIATGERLTTIYQFREVLEKQAAQIIQVGVAACGGILQAKKIAAMAESHYAFTAPHMYIGPIGLAAAIQLDCCTPNFLVQEFNRQEKVNELLRAPISVVDGYIIPPEGPGLGIKLNEKAVAEHRIRE